MEIIRFEIAVPKEMVPFINVQDTESELKRNALLIYPHIKNLTISHGRAAELLGTTKLELITLYNKLGLPYFDQRIEEVENDVLTIKNARGALTI